MVSVIPANQLSVGDLVDRYGLALAAQSDFFAEWSTNLEELTDAEKHYLDRVKANFMRLVQTSPLLENSVKMLVLSPLLDSAGLYDEPFRIESEASVELVVHDEDTVIRGRIDVLVLQDRLWLLVLESKRSDFSVNGAIGQALAYMMTNPSEDQPIFGMISNGVDFLFLKLEKQPHLRYAHSRLFSLLNPMNDLYEVLRVLKRIGHVIQEEV